jgi:hypothetical protein
MKAASLSQSEDNLEDSPGVAWAGTEQMTSSVLISSGDGVDPWRCTGYRHGFFV